MEIGSRNPGPRGVVSDPGLRGEAGEAGDSVRLCVVVFADQLIHRLGIVNSAAVDRPQNVFINISLCTSHSD